MKTLKSLAFLLLFCLPALAQINLSNQEPTIVFGMTNAFGRPDTNYFRVIPIQNPILANGTIITRGVAIRMYPDTNGIAYTNFAMGWFQMSNQFLGQGIIFEVPNNTNTYWAGSLARSGFNTYEMTGVLGLSSSNGTVSITPANGTGFVDLATTGQGSGSVTSIGLSMPPEFSVAGSPVTTAGTISVTKATEIANTVFAGPSIGGALAPTFRALADSDIPSHTVTIAGTANQISSSVGTAQQLANNPATTLSLPSPTIFPGKISVVGITNASGNSNSVAAYDGKTNLIYLSTGTGALTNDGSGNMGWLNGIGSGGGGSTWVRQTISGVFWYAQATSDANPLYYPFESGVQSGSLTYGSSLSGTVNYGPAGGYLTNLTMLVASPTLNTSTNFTLTICTNVVTADPVESALAVTATSSSSSANSSTLSAKLPSTTSNLYIKLQSNVAAGIVQQKVFWTLEWWHQ